MPDLSISSPRHEKSPLRGRAPAKILRSKRFAGRGGAGRKSAAFAFRRMPAKCALLRRGAEKRMFGGCALKASCRAEKLFAFSGSVCARHSREPPENAGSLNLFPAPRKKPAEGGPFRGAEKRIRTSGRVTPVTRFPIVLLKPLRHLCKIFSFHRCMRRAGKSAESMP